MSEIAEILGCSVNTIVYWMNKLGILRRSRSEATYVKRNPNGDPFKVKSSYNNREKFLFGLGLGIYWGEGDKLTKHQIRVANTDPNILRWFRRFLRTICQIEESKLKYYLICFNDSNPIKVRQYWADELNISEDKFGKIVKIPTQGKGTYKRKSQFGVCTIGFSNIKLKTWIMEELAKLHINAGIA